MRKLRQAVVVASATGILLLSGATVSAASTCPVGYTGPNSSNVCISTQTYECTVSNDTDVSVVGENAQGSVSGNAEGNGDTRTGTATNSNGGVFTITVTNSGVCTATLTTPPIEPPAPVVPTPGSGEVRIPVVAPVKTAPTVLANTSSSNMFGFLTVGLVAVGAGALLVKRALLRQAK